MQEYATGRAAGLPSPGEVHALDDATHQCFRIGIGVADERVLAAQLQQHWFQGIRSALHHRLAGWHAADERDLAHQRVLGQRFAAGPAAGEEIDDARGEDVADQLGQAQEGERRLIWGLHHHRIAGGEWGGDAQGREYQWMVIGDDARDDAHRLAHRIVEFPVAHRDGLAFNLGGEPGEVVEPVGGEPGIARQHGHRIARVECVEQGEFVGVLAQQVGRLA